MLDYKNYLYLQCRTFESGEMARQITLLRAFFMSKAWPIISYSSVPCGVLMHPLPDSGVRQRGAELFLFPLRLFHQHNVSF